MLAHRAELRPSVPAALSTPFPASEGTLHALFSHQPVERLDIGEALFWEGDAAKHVFEVTAGVLRIVRILSDGRRIITGFVYPGELLGVSFRNRYLYSVEAVTEVRVRRFARSRFEDELDRSPDLRPELFSRLCDEMAASQDQMVLLARKSAEERVASFLLALARRLGRDLDPQPILELPMTRLDMADYLGLTIETVSRTMSKLAGLGIVAQTGRHTLILRRPVKLAALAGDTDGE